MNAEKESPILDALDADSHQWLSLQNPDLLTAIEIEMGKGKSPEQIRRMIAAYVGPEREALSLRAYQAARHHARIQAR